MRHLITLILFVQCFAIPTVAQDTIAHPFSFYTGYHRGFLIAHRPLVAPLQEDKINGLEMALTKQTNGDRLWHHIYGFPEMGLSLSLWDLGNKRMLGKSVALIPYLDFPVIDGRRIALDLKFGWGAGFIQKNFDAEDNYKNVAVGSNLNFALILQPHIKVNLSQRISFTGGISLTHYSNAACQKKLNPSITSATAQKPTAR